MRATSSDAVICVALEQAVSVAPRIRTILVFIMHPLGLDEPESTHRDRTLKVTHSSDTASWGTCYAPAHARERMGDLGRMRRFAPALSVTLLGLALTAPLAAEDAGQWGFYSANEHATRYSPLAQIDASNVGGLRVAWRHKQADPAILAANPDLSLSNRWMVTPIYVGGLLYV